MLKDIFDDKKMNVEYLLSEIQHSFLLDIRISFLI